MSFSFGLDLELLSSLTMLAALPPRRRRRRRCAAPPHLDV